MGLYSSLLERRTTLSHPQSWLLDAWTATTTTSGASVTETSALTNPTVYSCVSLIADSLAQLPTKLYRKRAGGGFDDADDHDLYSILHDLPNPELTAFEFKQAMQGHLVLRNNAYAEVERDQFGRIVGLWPLRPDCMEVTRDEQKRRVWLYRMPDGGEVKWTWENPKVQPSPIVHLRGLGDGFSGYDTLRLMRETVGLAIAAEEYGARLFSNNAAPRGVLQTARPLSEQARARLKMAWDATHKGLSNANRVAVLEEGVTWQQVGMTPNDTQFTDLRKLQETQICARFRVPPHMVGITDKSTSWGSGIEAQKIGFLVFTLMPWIECWKQALKRDLLSAKTFATHDIGFVTQAFMRGDTAAQTQHFQQMLDRGVYSINDVLRLMDRNPIGTEGDRRFVMSTMTPLDRTDDVIDAQTAPVAAPAGPSNE
jgi:HK97 family phage portal protein